MPKPYIKRTLRDVGCSVLIGAVFAFWCWAAFIPLSSLYSKVGSIERELKEFRIEVAKNLY